MSEFAQAMSRARRRSESSETLAASIAQVVAKDTAKPDASAATTATPATTIESVQVPVDGGPDVKMKDPPLATLNLKETWSQRNIHSKKAGGETKQSSANKSNADWTVRFAEMTKLSIVEQAEKFLMQFVMEFRGKFSEVTDMALEFQGYAGPMSKGEIVQELDEFQCHQFLEKRGETLTVADLRKELKDIDIDSNGKVAFIEYLLFKYKKSLEDLFTETADGVDPELLAALQTAMNAFRVVAAAKAKRKKKMDKLKARAEKGGVLGKSAAHELECMVREDETERNRQEITAAAAQRKAKKAVKNADKSDMKRRALEAEKKKQEEKEAARKAEEKKRRQESELYFFIFYCGGVSSSSFVFIHVQDLISFLCFV